MEFLIISGMSGAGKTCVIDSLEDIGFFCVDNLPFKLISVLAKTYNYSNEYEKIAVVTDIRTGSFSADILSQTIDELESYGIKCSLMFIDADDSILLQRFKETRRPHPFEEFLNLSLADSISKERQILSSLIEKADYYMLTSGMSAPQCRARVQAMLGSGKLPTFSINVMSFGFKHGIPKDADYVFDVRFLPNPFYLDNLKHKTGLDKEVSDYVMSFESSEKYLKNIISMLKLAIPLCVEEGRTQLVICFGCTGGHHRSVTFAELVGNELKKAGYAACCSHRDIQK